MSATTSPRTTSIESTRAPRAPRGSREGRGSSVALLALAGCVARVSSAGLPASAVTAGARTRPDGRRLSWRTLQPWGPKLGPAHDVVLPFLIAWGAGTPHPGMDSPGGCMIDSLTAVSPAADTVAALLARAGVPTRVRRGAGERLELVLRCPKGRVAFP